MSVLKLKSGIKQYLTKSIGGAHIPVDLEGDPLTPGEPRMPLFTDEITGKQYVQVAEKIPTTNSAAARAQAKELNALNPIHYASASGDINGYFVEAPDFTAKGDTAAK